MHFRIPLSITLEWLLLDSAWPPNKISLVVRDSSAANRTERRIEADAGRHDAVLAQYPISGAMQPGSEDLRHVIKWS